MDKKKVIVLNLIFNLLTIMVVVVIVTTSKVSAKPTHSQIHQSFENGVLSYQGVLMDADGQSVSGQFGMTFSIYNTPTGSQPLWQEIYSGQNSVPIQNGLFNLRLGSINPIPNSVWTETALFLGIKVGDDVEMTPREILTSVPYAERASVAQLGLSVPDGSITKEKLDPEVTIPKIQSGRFFGDYVSNPEWSLHTGSGIRQFETEIFFPEPFNSIPQVSTSIYGMDMSTDYFSRLYVEQKNVSRNSFTLLIRTYADSIIYSVGVNWIAYSNE